MISFCGSSIMLPACGIISAIMKQNECCTCVVSDNASSNLTISMYPDKC